MVNARPFWFVLAALLSLTVAACGSGTAQGPGPVRPTNPPPPPPPSDNTPLPPPATGPFATVEFKANWGLGALNPTPAYEAAGTGAGVTVAVIDSGINFTHTDLDGNIHPQSRDLISRSSPALFGPSLHGTYSAGIIAAEKNQVGMHGVAFESQILALRIDSRGSCASDEGCTYFITDIARAIDFAVLNGAQIINISLGGDDTPFSLIPALQRAADAGVLIIISAGNDGAADPSAFAQVATNVGIFGNMLVVGAIGTNGTLASFSNQAGNTRAAYVVAPGVNIRTTGGGNSFTNVSGTSFSAPHVAGAAALLLSLFPNLTGRDLFDILRQTATDFGATGRDGVYGWGLIDIGAALQPLGNLSIVTSASFSDEISDIPMDDSGSGFSIPFGDSLFNIPGLTSVMMLDGFRRSYMIDVSRRVRPLYKQSLSLVDAIEARRHTQALYVPISRSDGLSMTYYDSNWRIRPIQNSLSMATRSLMRDQMPSSYFQKQLSGDMALSFSYGFSPGEILNREGGLQTPGRDFLAANFSSAPHLGFSNAAKITNLNKTLGSRVSVLIGAAFGDYNVAEYLPFARNQPRAYATASYLRAVRTSGRLSLALTTGFLDERNAILGSISTGALALGRGATTAFTGVQGELSFGKGITLFAQYQAGWTRVRGTTGSLFENVTSFRTSSFTAAVTKNGIFSRRDRLGIAVHQPLRAEGGNVTLFIPTGRDYASDTFLFTPGDTSLSPSSREFDLELSYRIFTAAGFSFEANLIHQFNPGHTVDLKHASAALLRLSRAY